MGSSRSSVPFQGDVPGMFLLPSVVPVEWIVSADSSLGLNLLMCLSLGSVYETWRLFFGAISHKQTPEEVFFFNGLLPTVLSFKTYSFLTCCFALLVRRDLRIHLAYQEGRCKGSFWERIQRSELLVVLFNP